MPILPEMLPSDYQQPVIYDERLIGLEFRDVELEREQIDNFWANIYVALLNCEQRYELSSGFV